MLRRSASGRGAPEYVAITAGVLIICVCAAAAILGPSDRVGSLSIILGLAAAVAGLLYEGESGSLTISASFIVWFLAAALLGPLSALAAAAIVELCAALRLRTPVRDVVVINLPACLVPAVVEALVIHALAWPPRDAVLFYVVAGLTSFGGIVLSFLMFAALQRFDEPPHVEPQPI